MADVDWKYTYIWKYTDATDDELKLMISMGYIHCETQWQAWRKENPYDVRDGVDYSGSPIEDKIGADWRAFTILFDEWERRHPAPDGYFWGIGNSEVNYAPVLYKRWFDASMLDNVTPQNNSRILSQDNHTSVVRLLLYIRKLMANLPLIGQSR